MPCLVVRASMTGVWAATAIVSCRAATDNSIVRRRRPPAVTATGRRIDLESRHGEFDVVVPGSQANEREFAARVRDCATRVGSRSGDSHARKRIASGVSDDSREGSEFDLRGQQRDHEHDHHNRSPHARCAWLHLPGRRLWSIRIDDWHRAHRKARASNDLTLALDTARR